MLQKLMFGLMLVVALSCTEEKKDGPDFINDFIGTHTRSAYLAFGEPTVSRPVYHLTDELYEEEYTGTFEYTHLSCCSRPVLYNEFFPEGLDLHKRFKTVLLIFFKGNLISWSGKETISDRW